MIWDAKGKNNISSDIAAADEFAGLADGYTRYYKLRYIGFIKRRNDYTIPCMPKNSMKESILFCRKILKKKEVLLFSTLPDFWKSRTV